MITQAAIAKRWRVPVLAAVCVLFGACAMPAGRDSSTNRQPAGPAPAAAPDSSLRPLPVPAGGEIPVAFVISTDAEVLDFCGPLEVFAGAWSADGHALFKPYFVAATLDPVTVGGGMRVVPDYTFANAPAPRVVVIPAMGPPPNEMIDWIRRVSSATDVTMSVCNGAFVLAKTGLLDHRPATAHHGGYFRFAGRFPDVQLQRGARYVEVGNLASSGGISSGIDLALRVVERYAGRDMAQSIVDGMEYQSTGWLHPNSNEAYARLPRSTLENPVCPLCQMPADTTIRSEYRGTTYYFCSADEKTFFDEHPAVVDRFLAEDAARDAGAAKP